MILNRYTGQPDRMSHRKWREIKQQPSRARQGQEISCCIVALHFLCDILSGRPGCTQFAHKHHRQLLKTAPQSLYGAIPIRVMGSVYMPRGEGPHLKMRNISRSVILVLCLIHNRRTRGYCHYRDGQKMLNELASVSISRGRIMQHFFCHLCNVDTLECYGCESN